MGIVLQELRHAIRDQIFLNENKKLHLQAGFLLSFGHTVEQNRLWSHIKAISGIPMVASLYRLTDDYTYLLNM